MKKFDCVEIQHLGAEKLKEKTESMSKEQEAKFWQERTQHLREHYKALISQSNEALAKT